MFQLGGKVVGNNTAGLLHQAVFSIDRVETVMLYLTPAREVLAYISRASL